MKKYLVALLTIAVVAVPGVALAQDDPPDTQPNAPTLLPTPAPPTTPVTDENGAGLFAKAFLVANAGQLVPGGRAIDVDLAGCRQVDAVSRFYCLLRARVAQVQRVVIVRYVVRGHNRHVRAAGDNPPYGNNDNRHNDNRDNRHRDRVRVVLFRVRLFSCVAVVRIVGGPAVAPTATLPVRDCAQIPRPTPLT